MKKYFMLLMCCLFLISCGKNYKVYSRKEKEEMYDIALAEKKQGKSEKMEYIHKLYEELEMAYKKGDKTAEIELREWHYEMTKYRSYVDEVKGLSADLMNRNW